MNSKFGNAGLMTMAALAAVFVLTRQQSTNADSESSSNDPADPSPPDAPMKSHADDSFARLASFLFAIRTAENRGVADDERYFRFYGNSRFKDFSDHPVNTGEKIGIPLSASMCRNAGLNPPCVSTAAGAYQITRPTWDRIRSAWPRLSDFGVSAQDEAARRLLKETGALAALDAGDFDGAVALAAPTWASLPGSTARQGGVSLATLSDLYTVALESFG